jgi:hypothetical protein
MKQSSLARQFRAGDLLFLSFVAKSRSAAPPSKSSQHETGSLRSEG